MALKLRRGTDAARQNFTPAEGELIYTTDNKQLFVGDGITAGGNPASGGGVVSGLSVPAGDPFYAEAQANLNDPFLDGDLHLRGYNIVGTGNIDIDGNITISGNLQIGDGGGSDAINFAAGVGSNIFPTNTLAYSLGTLDKSWSAVYAGSGYFSQISVANDIDLSEFVGIGGATVGSLKGNVVGADSSVLVDYTNSSIPGSAISGTVVANLQGNVTGNVTGNLSGNATIDTLYGNDGITRVIDGNVGGVDGVTLFGRLEGTVFGELEGDVQGSVFGDDSTLLVDGINNIISGVSANFATVNANIVQSGSQLTATGNGVSITALGGGSLSITGSGLSIVDNASGTAISDSNGITVTGAVDLSGADLTATAVTFGAVTTGNLTVGGNLTATGNIAATTADTLAIARTINGVAFDGSANILVEDNTKLPTSGAIPMLGDLTLANSTPSNVLHAVSKGYVDNKFFDPSVNTTISATETTYTGAILVSDLREESSGQGLAISSVNGNIGINAGTGTVSIQGLAGGSVTISGLDITGNNIQTTDSSAINVVQATTFQSDVVVDGRLTVGELDATTIQTAAAGVPRLESDTNLEISVPNGHINVTDGLFKLAAYTGAGVVADFTPVDGDMAFIEDATLPQPHVYTGDMWMPMMSPTIGWVLGANGTTDFTFTGPGFSGTVTDPAFTVYRGHTYVFDNSANGASHPFNLQTVDPSVAGYSAGDLYTTGTTGDNQGIYVWTVPMDAPSTLYYVCTNHGGAMFGTITVA